MLQELAKEAILPAVSLPANNILIDIVNPDWDGTPRIYITCEPTKTKDETQFGAISAETLMRVTALAEEREEAQNLMQAAAHAVYAQFTVLEQTRHSGILCITPVEHNTTQVPDRNSFISFAVFRILHSPNLSP